MKRILIIDDDKDLLSLMDGFLTNNGYEVKTEANGKSGLKAIDNTIDLVICDLKLPDFNGLDILSSIKKLRPFLPVVLITGYSDVKTAVEALRRGALDYVTKPLYPDEILLLLKDIAAKHPAQVNKAEAMPKEKPSSNSGSVKAKVTEDIDSKTYVKGSCHLIQNLNKNLELVAPTNMSVLILGETGSGKEYVAKRLHELSDRSKKPFVSLDCGALPKELAASELFGHKKGSFTGALNDKIGHFEMADGGTLFLDEIGNLSYENQVKLLRVLQERVVKRIGSNEERKVDIRLVVATNENLSERISSGEFREDLYHRINEFTLHLPPLRKREKDILVFANHFLQLSNQQLGKEVKGISDVVQDRFLSYQWPGNLREMRNVLKRSVLLCQGNEIGKNDIPAELVLNHTVDSEVSYEDMDLKSITERAEKNAIILALKKYQYNKTRVAKALNVDRKTLYNKISNYGIEG